MLLAVATLIVGAWTETTNAAERDRLDFAGNEAAQAALAIPAALLSPHEALGPRTESLAPDSAPSQPVRVPTVVPQFEGAPSGVAVPPAMPNLLRTPPTRVRAWTRSTPVRRAALEQSTTPAPDTSYPAWAIRALEP